MQLLISKDADSLWLPIIDIGAHEMGLNGLNGSSSRPMCCNSSLSPLWNRHILSNLLRITFGLLCVAAAAALFSLSPLCSTFRMQIKSKFQVAKGSVFLFFSFLCGGCRLNSSSSSSCYGLLLLLFPSLKYTILYLVNSVFQHLSRSLNNSTLASFCFCFFPQLGADIIFCSRGISVAYM